MCSYMNKSIIAKETIEAATLFYAILLCRIANVGGSDFSRRLAHTRSHYTVRCSLSPNPEGCWVSRLYMFKNLDKTLKKKCR